MTLHPAEAAAPSSAAFPAPSDAPVRKREILGWACFDFANSSYTTVVITAIYSGFFTRHIVPEGSGMRDSWWSIAIAASTIIALVLSPLVGAVSDLSGKKKSWLLGSAITCAVATMALWFVGRGDILLGVALVAISNAAFMLSESFCGSFLPDVSDEKNMGRISGLGWGLGYFGGLASLALVLQVAGTKDDGTLGDVVVRENQLAMVLTGAFFLLAALPTFILLRNRARPRPGFEGAGFLKLARAGVARLRATVAEARQHRVLFRFLLAFMVYMAGVDAVIKFVGIYATSELAFETGDLVKMFLVLQISAAAGALGFGFLESRLGAKTTVMATLAWWIMGILAIYFLDALAGAAGIDRKTMFLYVAIVAGTGLGSVQSSSRTVVGLLAPKDRSAEMFGFWGLFGRLSTLLGVSFGFVSDAFDSRKAALLLVCGFFVVGMAMLSRIPVAEGIRARRNA